MISCIKLTHVSKLTVTNFKPFPHITSHYMYTVPVVHRGRLKSSSLAPIWPQGPD